ncbi:MAG: sugar ABC transporter substrate-binding protein, partial [Spirochaetes bacterium]
LIIFFISLITLPSLAKEVTLKISSEVGIHTEAWKTDLKRLYKEKGIKVKLEQFPFKKYREKLMLDYQSGSPSYDVNYLSYGWYRALVDGGHLYPLSNFDIKGLNLSEVPNINLFFGKDKKLYFMPFMNEIAGIIYRKDLFENPTEKKNFKAKYGYDLAPPKTFKQYRDIAEFFYRPPKLYGVSLMGKRSVFLTVHFMNRLWGRGGDILDKNMKPILNSPEGVEALNDLKEMFKYANPAASTHLFHEAVTEFTQGKSAMLEIWSTVMLYAEDPKKSRVVGKVSFAPIPRRKDFLNKEVPYLYIAWGFVIANKSKKKDAAFEFIKYITSKESMIRTTPHGNIPARLSVMDAPEVLKVFPWMKTIKETMLKSKLTPIYPWIPEGVTISADYISLAVSQFLSGEKSAKEALKEADRKIYKLLKEGGYYK